MGYSASGLAADNAAILTQICVFVKTSRLLPQRFLEGLMEPTQSKPITVGQRLCRLSTAAVQQELRLFAEHEPERKRRRWKHCGTMEHAADFPGDIPLAPDIGCHRVHRPAHARILQCPPAQPNDVVEANPREPLATVAQRTAEKESKWQGQQSESERRA